MIRSIFRIAFLAMMLPVIATSTITANAADEFTKTWEKVFEVDKNATFDLNNKFGDVHITTWNENKIDVKVKITVDVGSKEKANKILSSIIIESSASKTLVTVRTRFDDNFSSKSNSNIHINYTVRMPLSNSLKLSNKFGDFYLSELNGKADIDADYANVKIGILRNSENEMDLDFSEATIEDYGSGSLDISYTELTINKVVKVDVDSKFSELDIKNLQTINLDSQYDEVKLGTLIEADIDGKFSEYEIDGLMKSLKLDIRYGECEIDNISKNFEFIDIDNAFGSVDLEFEEGASFQLDVDVSFGSVDFPKSKFNIISEDKGYTSHELKAVSKEGSKSGKVKIDSSNGSVSIDID